MIKEKENNMREYQSTRGSEKKLRGAQAIIQGIAEDKGLFVPVEIPALPFRISDMIGSSYRDVAFGSSVRFLMIIQRKKCVTV